MAWRPVTPSSPAPAAHRFAASGPDRMTEPSQRFSGRKRLVARGIAFPLSAAQPDTVRQIKSYLLHLSRGGAAVENLSHSASLHAASVVPPHSGTKHLSVRCSLSI